MAPVLQCPDCGTKHPLGEVPTHGAFPCRGCGRSLQVPEVVSQRAATQDPSRSGARAGAPAAPIPGAAAPGAPIPGPGSVPPPGPTAPRPVPVARAVSNPAAATTPPAPSRPRTGADEQALGALSRPGRRPPARLAPVPWWMRLLLWFVAIPLSFLFVFLFARAFHQFTTNQLSDVFLANNTGRFWPVARLLPFVALVTAALVQAGVYGLARLRGRLRENRSSSPVVPATSRSRTR